MPVAEYLAFAQYDAVEPLGVSYAMDAIMAGLKYINATAHGVKHTRPGDYFTFLPKPPVDAVYILDGLFRMGFKESGNA